MTTEPVPREELVTVSELALLYRLSRPTIWNYLRQHNLQRYRVPGQGRTTYVRRADFDRIVNQGLPSTRPD